MSMLSLKSCLGNEDQFRVVTHFSVDPNHPSMIVHRVYVYNYTRASSDVTDPYITPQIDVSEYRLSLLYTGRTLHRQGYLV